MRAFLLTVSAMALVLATGGVHAYDYPHIDNFAEAGECVPNKSFYDKCNLCHCSPDGKSAACNLKACPDYNTIRIDNYVSGQKCPAGKKFFDKCNTCGCSASGLSAACTKMACPEFENAPASRTRRSLESQVIPHIDNFEEAQECVPNKRFYNQCNLCYCSPDGKSAACTLKACEDYKVIRIDNYVQKQKCPAGKSFFDKCNSCKCSSDGLSAGCTMMACPEYENVPAPRSRRSVEAKIPHIDNFEEAGECVPNKSFYDKCNLCHCSPDGKSAACNLKACPDYNTIRIDNYVSGQKCPAGKKFFDKCNICGCSASGLSAGCTRMACPEFEDVPVSRSRRSVEVKIPHIDNFSEVRECVPNKSFYDKCNLCHCSPNGKSAACNLKACPEYNTIRIDNYDNHMKCPAGRQFYNKCNSCKCSADGLSAFCTLAACPNEE